MSDVSSQPPTRPPLLRGNTVPLYVRTASSSSSSGQDHQRQTAESFGQPHSAHPERYGSAGPRLGESTSRHQHHMSLSQAGHMANSSARQLWGMGGVLPTPPLSTSPGSADSYLEETYFPPMQVAPHPGSSIARYSKSQGYPPPPLASASHSPASPTVISPTYQHQLLRSARGQAPQQSAKMSINCTPTDYILSAIIGPGFDSNCITIAARKGNNLDIVADRWDCEQDCHHEWKINFDRDADMSGIKAEYTNGVLTVTVKRLNYPSTRPPQMRT